MMRRNSGWAALAISVTACAPMEQAPLVYTSKTLIGAHVEAGAPDNAGLSVNVGSKTLDAAFVPVAVAKWCFNGRDCSHEVYKRELILGTSDEDTNSSLYRQLQAVAVEIAKIEKEKQDAEVELDQLQSLARANGEKLARADGLTKTINELTKAREADPLSFAAQDLTRLADAEAELKNIRTLESTSTIEKRMEGPTASIRRLSESLRQAKESQQKLEADLLLARKENKKDAYSVYGSFEGKTAGNRDGANLALGKVFSTGVAAQNVTQGIRNAAINVSRTDCLRAVGEAIEKAMDPEKAELRKLQVACLK